MLLSYENIAHYLLEKGLISLESIIQGEFSVRDQSSRNANFAVNREYKPGYLVKQVRAHDLEKKETLRIEATCYWLAQNDPAYRALQAFLPKYFEYDYLQHVLILELLPGVENLNDHYKRHHYFSLSVAHKLADLLASYHNYTPGLLEGQKSYSLFKKQKPWVFSFTQDRLEEWRKNPGMGTAEKQAIEMILNNAAFLEHLKTAGEGWSPSSLIHGDVKFPNFLINHDFNDTDSPVIRLIDWELADVGDPVWDVAAVVQNYLTLWAASTLQESFAGTQHESPVTLEQLQPSIRAFWDRYCELTGWDAPETKIQLEKMLRYTALKLMHTCFETVNGVKDMHLYSVKILQLALNLLKRPEEALVEILGIQTPEKSYATSIIS